LSLLLRGLGLGLFLPEVAVDFVVGRIPGDIEAFFIRTMGDGAKVLGLITALLVFLALSGAYALPYRALARRIQGRWALLGILAAGYAFASLLVVVPLLGGGLLGADTASGAGFATFGQVLSGLLYAAVLDYILVEIASRYPSGFRPSRRQFVVGLGILFFGAALAAVGFGALVARSARLAFATVTDLFANEITPNDRFYRVTKNLIDPDVDRVAWRLEIDGLVSTPTSFTLATLASLPPAEDVITLECVSNEVGGNLISTARWSGAALADLLAPTGVASDADWVAFTCADGYTVGVPRSRALGGGSLLALRMNGVDLPPAHGGPARIVVAGLYGMFSAKWVTRISLVRGEFFGFWQEKGWTNRGLVRTTAIITTPAPDSRASGPTTIAGIAFAGDRGISRVDVSVDGGTTWQPASLRTPPPGRATWVLWTFAWVPGRTGSHRIVARATDGSGTPQEPQPAPPFPDGASGYDAITLLVA
jgi:DMSO/TMAO reductase YedYZ molybdopterin-dependent catalytic subunit